MKMFKRFATCAMALALSLTAAFASAADKKLDAPVINDVKINDYNFTLKWEPVENAKSYKVWYLEDGIGMELWRSTTKASYTHYGALKGKNYKVWVVAQPKSGYEASDASEAVVVPFWVEPTDEPADEPTVDEPTTDEPTVEEPKEEPKEDKLPALKLKTKQNKSGYFEIKWEAVEGASMYKVWYQEPGIGMDLWRSTTGTTYKHYGALSKKYTVWVVAMKGGEEISQPSAKVVVDFTAGKQDKAIDISDLNEEVADEPTTDEPTTDEPIVEEPKEEDKPVVEEPKEEDALPVLKLKTKQNKSGYFEIKWEAVEGATMYKVWYQEPGIGMDLWRSTTGTTYKHYGALSKKYTVWVVAMKGGEEISQPSAKVVVDFTAGKQDKAIDISDLNEEVADDNNENADDNNENADDNNENADDNNENADDNNENADDNNENADDNNENADDNKENADEEDALPVLKLKTKQNKSGYFEIKWEAVEGATMYKVWYQEPGIGMDLWRSTTGTTYKHYGALAKKYTVWVVAMKGGEEISQPSAKVVVDFTAGKQDKAIDISDLNEEVADEPTTDEPTTDEPTVDEPTTDEPTVEEPKEEDALPVLNLKTKQNKSGYFEITWEAVEGASMYKVWYQEPGIGMDLWRSTTGTTYKHYGALAKKYTVWVVAMKGGEEISQPSAKVVVDFAAGKDAKAEDISYLNATEEPETPAEPETPEEPAWAINSASVNEEGMLTLDIDAVEGAAYYEIGCAAGHAEELEPVIVGGFDAVDAIDTTVDCWVCETIATSIYVVAYDENGVELDRTEAFAL